MGKGGRREELEDAAKLDEGTCGNKPVVGWPTDNLGREMFSVQFETVYFADVNSFYTSL